MGKHKRKHADRDRDADIEEVVTVPVPVDATPENNMDLDEDADATLPIVPRKKVKKHKHKKSRERDESSERDRERSESPPKSKSTSKHNGYLEEPDEEVNRGRGRSLISPLRTKKKKSSDKDRHEEVVQNGIHDYDYDDQPLSARTMDRKSVRYAVNIDDPLTAKILQDMKKGLVDATVGDPGTLAAEELEADDVEIFIIQCPENVNPAELLDGKKIKFGNDLVTPLKRTDDASYESVFLTDENEKTVTIVLPDTFGNTRVVSSTLAGHIVVREAIDELQAPTLIAEDKPVHELPVGLKERHPVFGTDFTIPLKSLEYVPGKKKSKKKSKKSKDEDGPEIHFPKDNYEDFPAPVIIPTSKEKRHKRKEIPEPLTIEPEPEVETTDDSQSRKKKKKKSKRSKETKDEDSAAEYVETKPAIEETLDIEVESTSTKHKKKKKDKKSRSEVY